MRFQTINRASMNFEKTEDISGVPSGFASLDRITYGWQPTDLIILAARPSVGKPFCAEPCIAMAMRLDQANCRGFFTAYERFNSWCNVYSPPKGDMMEKIYRGKLEEI